MPSEHNCTAVYVYLSMYNYCASVRCSGDDNMHSSQLFIRTHIVSLLASFVVVYNDQPHPDLEFFLCCCGRRLAARCIIKTPSAANRRPAPRVVYLLDHAS